MKKLMIMVAAIAMSVVANANTVTWGLASGNALDATIYKSGTAYLFDKTKLAIPDLFSSKADASQWFNKNSSSFSVQAFRTGTIKDGTFSATEVITTLRGRLNYWLLFVNDTEDHIAIPTLTKAINWSSGTTATSLEWATTNMKSYEITSTPEPTSGLLMLLGLAGLALKRKRA